MQRKIGAALAAAVLLASATTLTFAQGGGTSGTGTGGVGTGGANGAAGQNPGLGQDPNAVINHTPCGTSTTANGSASGQSNSNNNTSTNGGVAAGC